MFSKAQPLGLCSLCPNLPHTSHLLCVDSEPYPALGTIPNPMTLELTHYIIAVLVRRHSFGWQCGCFRHEVAGAQEAELKGQVGEEEKD